jgi:hypothetical protein
MAKMSESFVMPSISLTIAAGAKDYAPGSIVEVPTSELIAYDQEMGFTRLVLVGGRVLGVTEPTDQIDRLVRIAASGGSF